MLHFTTLRLKAASNSNQNHKYTTLPYYIKRFPSLSPNTGQRVKHCRLQRQKQQCGGRKEGWKLNWSKIEKHSRTTPDTCKKKCKLLLQAMDANAVLEKSGPGIQIRNRKGAERKGTGLADAAKGQVLSTLSHTVSTLYITWLPLQLPPLPPPPKNTQNKSDTGEWNLQWGWMSRKRHLIISRQASCSSS